MSLTKYASFQVLSAQMAPQTGARGLRRWAHRHGFQYDPKPGFLYVRSRAISSRCNDNYDEFPAEEIKKAYKTFIGKPVFVNHNNDNHRRARGVIIDAALHEDRNPDGSPDTWTEVLMEVDAVKFPKLAQAILAGHIDRTSMGTDVAFSVCSVCNNKATNPAEYCQHIPKMKGQRIYRTTASGTKEGILVREICYGLGFFENSLLVEEPADPTAFFLGVEAGPGVKTASKTCPGVNQQAPDAKMEGRGATGSMKGTCPGCQTKQRTSVSGRVLSHVVPDDHKTARKTADWSYSQHAKPIVHVMGQRPPRPLMAGDTLLHPDSGYSARIVSHTPRLLLLEGRSTPVWRKPMEGDDSDSIMGITHEDAADMEVGSPEEREFLKSNPTGPSKWSRKVAHLDDDHTELSPKPERWSIPISDGDREFYRQMHEQGQTDKEMADHADRRPVNLRDPADLASHMMTAHQWEDDDLWRSNNNHILGEHDEEDRPLTHHEMMRVHDHEHSPEGYGSDWPHAITMGGSHFHEASRKTANFSSPEAGMAEAERRAIKNHHDLGPWEQFSADHPDNYIAHCNSCGGDATVGASNNGGHYLVGPVPHKECEADPRESAREGATNAAQLWLENDQSDYNNIHHIVNTSHHPVETAHMLDKYVRSLPSSHGLNEELRDNGWTHDDIDTDDWAHKLHHERDLQGGEQIHPSDADYHNFTAFWKGSMRKGAPFAGYEDFEDCEQENSDKDDPAAYCGEIKHRTEDKKKGSAFKQRVLAYGETMAPADVDTLRDEECPVCGEANAYDGNECQVCGYVAPPEMFRDPNLDLAKSLDLRKDNLDGMNADPNGDGMPDVIPGSGVPGTDQIPIDANEIPDPDNVGQEQVNQIVENQEPLDPEELGPNGEPLVNPEDEMLDPNVQRGLEGQQPQEPVDPDEIAPDGQAYSEDNDVASGTPMDGVPDLTCDNCGYQADATQPESVDTTDPAARPDGLVEGDMCPNCGQGLMLDPGSMNTLINSQIPVQ